MFDPRMTAYYRFTGNHKPSTYNSQIQQRGPMSIAEIRGMQNAYVPPEVLRLRQAQSIAAEVRARRPEMQVKKVTP